MREKDLKTMNAQDISWFTQWMEELEDHLKAAGREVEDARRAIENVGKKVKTTGKELAAARKMAAKIMKKWKIK